jgi:rSAM/selenodomain-associated transferase 1
VKVLVVAKAPVPGQVKTRLGAEIGHDAAARVAAAALLDTLAACNATGADRHLSLAGDLAEAVEGRQITAALAGWTVTPQRGDGLAERLVAAHLDAGAGVVVQVGMDTPQVSAEALHAAAAALHAHDAVLGPAWDGGWWVLARRDPDHVQALAGVPMSTSSTLEETHTALEWAGCRVGRTAPLRDVDTVADADHVAALAPWTRFATAWREVDSARRSR